jgi:hypothetical protein
VPVHPVLAKVLAEWKLHGWPARHGRRPAASDLIVPNIEGRNRDGRRSLMDFLEDLDHLELRRRRQYDARRTFMSLALDDGASKDVIRWITHPRPTDVFDMYITVSWKALCEAVNCIQVEVKTGEIVALHPAEDPRNSNRIATEAGSKQANEKGPQLSRVTGP